MPGSAIAGLDILPPTAAPQRPPLWILPRILPRPCAVRRFNSAASGSSGERTLVLGVAHEEVWQRDLSTRALGSRDTLKSWREQLVRMAYSTALCNNAQRWSITWRSGWPNRMGRRCRQSLPELAPGSIFLAGTSHA
jgi:hypothetical protein